MKMLSPVPKISITVAVPIVLTGIYLALADSEYLCLFTEPNMLIANIREMRILGPILIIGLMSVAIVINPLPSAPVALAAGAVYGHTLGTVYVVAGAGHSHDPVTQQQAVQVATRIVSTLVKRGVIEESWDATQVEMSEQKVFGGRTEWVVSYRNDAVSDPSKRVLYIFLTLAGEYIAANYTGQ